MPLTDEQLELYQQNLKQQADKAGAAQLGNIGMGGPTYGSSSMTNTVNPYNYARMNDYMQALAQRENLAQQWQNTANQRMLAQSQIRGMANEHARGIASIGLQRQKQEWDKALSEKQLEQQKEAEARLHMRGTRQLQQQEAESARTHARGTRGLDIQEMAERNTQQRGMRQLQQQERESGLTHARGVRGLDIQQATAEQEQARGLQALRIQERQGLLEHQSRERGLGLQERHGTWEHQSRERQLDLQQEIGRLENLSRERGLTIQEQANLRENQRQLRALEQQEASDIRTHYRGTRGLGLQEEQMRLENLRGTRSLNIQQQTAGRTHALEMERLRQQEEAERRASARGERGLDIQQEANRELAGYHKASLGEQWKRALMEDVHKKEELKLLKSRQEDQSNAQKRADILARRQQLINQRNFGKEFDLNKWKAHTDANLRSLDLEINADKMRQLIEHKEALPTNMSREQELDFLADLLNKTSAGRNADRDRDMAQRGQEIGAIGQRLQNRQYLASLNHQTLNMLTQNFASLPLMMGMF